MAVGIFRLSTDPPVAQANTPRVPPAFCVVSLVVLADGWPNGQKS